MWKLQIRRKNHDHSYTI